MDECMKYFCGEPEIVVKLREMFPTMKMSRSPGTGSLWVCHKKVWKEWQYEAMAPEQMLDTMVDNVERHFGVKALKSKNGKIHD